MYRPPDADIVTCENQFKKLFGKNETINKYVVLACNFALNVLDFENNKNPQNFINLTCCCNMIAFQMSEKKVYRKSKKHICIKFLMKLTIQIRLTRNFLNLSRIYTTNVFLRSK